MSSPVQRARHRLQLALDAHQRVHDPAREPRNRLAWLGPLRAWQAARLRASFEHLLADPRSRPAATFFLEDLYDDRDFSQRDRDMAKVAPLMARLLPAHLVQALAGAIALGAISHAFDLRMAAALASRWPRPGTLDVDAYGWAYREAGHPRARARQIALVTGVGGTLAAAVRMVGVEQLLRASRLPARLAGVAALQQFLERGFRAFGQLPDHAAFLEDIATREAEVSRRLFAGAKAPFEVGAGAMPAAGAQPNSRSR